MVRRWPAAGYVMVGWMWACVSNLAADETAVPRTASHWIWSAQAAAERTAARPVPAASPQFFRRSFTRDSDAATARLHVVADFCELEVFVNGQLLGAVDAYTAPASWEVQKYLRPGANAIAVRATPVGGPAAFALELIATAETNQSGTALVSDRKWLCASAAPDNWQAADFVAADWSPVAEYGSLAVESAIAWQRDADVSPLEDYTQWEQAKGTAAGTDPATFRVPDGFVVERLRSATPDEGSWVSMTFDPRGRVVIGREDRGLLRLTLTDDRRDVAAVETIDDTLLECRGLLFAFGELYASANNSKGLYRLRDTDGDDRFERVELLHGLPGGVGHGRNCLALGPDQHLYWISGDAVDLPTEIDDWTSPFSEHRRGVATKEGFVLRIDRDGGHAQLLTTGLRNPFGIAFDRFGEMFAYDADAEFDMGSPWYRPTRVNHLVPGGDFGWRAVTGRWPPYFPDQPEHAVPTIDIGKGSPTAVMFGYRSNFPSPLCDALFILDWAYGRIVAVHLEPRGASYIGRPETFLKGRPLNVTGLDFGPDGAMYFVTGGRKTQSALYRVRYTASHPRLLLPTPQQTARRQHAVASRAFRRQLETLCDPATERPATEAALEAAWPWLANTDPCLRHAARMAIEHQPLASWRERALQETNPTAALAALLTLARGGDSSARQAAVLRLVVLPLDHADTVDRLTALRIIELAMEEDRVDHGSLRSAVLPLVTALTPDPSPLVHRRLARLLVTLDADDAVGRVLALLSRSEDQAERMQYLFVLRQASRGWTPAHREAYFTALAQTRNFLGGDGMPGFLKTIRQEALAALPDEERLRWTDWLAQQERDESPLPEARPLIRKWTCAELAAAVASVQQPASRLANRENGKTLFQAALCSRCHRCGTIGTPVGPDLTFVSSRFGRRDLLQHIVEPSRVVAENYRPVQIETSDGKLLVGRILQAGDYRSPMLKIATDPLQPSAVVEVAKRDIIAHQESLLSPMPAGLLDVLTAAEVLDLLAFIESGGSLAP